MERRLTNDELEAETNLIEKIDAIMEPGKKYFCRFSTRSPKDGVSVPREELENLNIVQRLQRKLQLLCVTNGTEVVRILMRHALIDQILSYKGRSQRIFSDINFYYQYRVPNSTSSKLCDFYSLPS